MLDNSNLKEPFDVSSIEEEVSTLVGNRGTEPYASPFRRLNSGADSRLPQPTLEDSAEVVADAGTEDAAKDFKGTELSRLSIFIRNSDKQSLFTFIELEGYPILRISLDGQSHDLILNNDQVKLLLRQMTLWLTR